MRKQLNDYNKRKGDDAMSATVKPKTGAFVLKAEKCEVFLAHKTNTAEKAIGRFKAHKPKNGIVNPFKK